VPGDPDRTAPERPSGVDARPGLQIGRYQLLTLVGAGGMGIVWGAWDPELERRVAIKLVRETHPAARERMLREGKSLARLSHPNIVPVFDVGEVGDTLYLVMEWVRGMTLREFAAAAPGWPALIEAYRQAGAGLAAAHAAGVIHRDFKPENAIRGDDGRVRVLDFGLAIDSEQGTSSDRAGTRRYMAPEQVRGEQVTAACDQYAVAVALAEALERTPGVPGWVAPILARGQAVDAAARYPSLAVLVTALARDPRARRRRLLLAAIVLTAAAGAFALGATRSRGAAGTPLDPCSGGADEVAAIWAPARRDSILAPLRQVRSTAVVGGVATALDQFAATWAAEHRRGCLSNRRGELSEGQYQTGRSCLAQSRARLDAVVEVLATVDDVSADGAVLAVRSLPDASACAEGPVMVPPPAALAGAVRAVAADIERALVHVQADQRDQVELARAATTAARRVGYAPLIARALLVEGRARDFDRTDWVEIEAVLTEAMTTALAVGDDLTAVEAYARWLLWTAVQGSRELGSWSAMAAIAERLGHRGRAARALLLNNRAIAQRAAGDSSGARALLREARAVRGDEPDPELVCIETNLTSLATEPEEAEASLRTALGRYQQDLGPEHRRTVWVRWSLTGLEPDRAIARAELESVCVELATRQGIGSESDLCELQLGWLMEADGDRSAALAAMARAVAHPSSAEVTADATAFIAVATDRPEAARLVAELEASTHAPMTADWEPTQRAGRIALIAWAADQRGDLAASTAAWRRVIDVLTTTRFAVDGRLMAQAQAMLAERAATSQPAAARDLATAALRWYRRSPGDRALVARLERIAAPR